MRNTFTADPSFNVTDLQIDYVDCKVTVSTLQYNIVSAISTIPESNPTSALLVQSYFSSLGEGGPTESNGALRGSLLSAIEAFTSTFASQLSAGLLAEMLPSLSLGRILQNKPEIALLSRVPLAPLGTLVALCLPYVLLGVGFTVLAIANSLASSRDVRICISTPGIVANSCNVPRYSSRDMSVQDMFYDKGVEKQEHKRVGITRTKGGKWVFGIWNYLDG
jgi:hypothetical protein